MNRVRLATLAFSLIAGIALAGCASEDVPEPEAEELPLVSVGPAALRMEFATTPAQRRRGLMHRASIDHDYGMLFVFDEPQSMSFYMRNVRFPIDIGFFTADGILREVYPMYPYDERSRQSARDDLLFALETSSEWFRKNGVKPGDRLDLDAVQRALNK